MKTTSADRAGSRAILALALLLIVLAGGCSQARETASEAGRTAGNAADALPGVGEESLEATLTGAAEVPGPGDPDGRGEAEVSFDLEDGEVCYELEVNNIDSPTAAHIHRGAAGAAGPPVVDFKLADNGLDGCVTGVDKALLQSILDAPANFYVNVHTPPFPAGAIRGQLEED